MSDTFLEKLRLINENNILIQGLPSSMEKLFSRVSFAKNITPLLRTRKIDFALVFAVSETQLNSILDDIKFALKDNAKLWVAYPKPMSKITTDLSREGSLSSLIGSDFAYQDEISLDKVWKADLYIKVGPEAFYKASLGILEQKNNVLDLFFSSDEFSPEEISQVITLLSDIYTSIGGDQLEIKKMNSYELANVLQPDYI